jgi:hypothetical protein
MATFKQSFGFRDCQGNVRRLTLYLSAADAAAASTAAQAIATAAGAISLAALQSATGPYHLEAAPTYGSTGQYEDVEDKAVMTFATANGGVHRYRIPAPGQFIFWADQKTVNGSQSVVGDFTDAIIGHACSRDGNVLTTFVGGTRARGPTSRRLNVYLKSANLDQPAE